MKIVIAAGIFPPDIGGPATYVPRIATELSARGHEITVVTTSDVVSHPEDRGYSFRVVRIPRSLPKPVRMARTLTTLVRMGRHADAMLSNGMYIEPPLARMASKRPLVQKIVGDMAWERATNLGWVRDTFEEFQLRRYGARVEALKRLRSWCARRSDAVIAPSRYLAGWVERWGIPQSRISVIYNAPDVERAEVPLQVPLETPFKAITVGRLVSWKRIDGIIRALSDVEGAGLVVVGDGPEEENLRGLARTLRIENRVFFAGRRSHAETMAMLAASHVLVLNSTYEGLPHVVVEALAMGKPVIATAVGGTPEVVTEGVNGKLIPMGAQFCLSQAMKAIRDSPPLLARLSKGASASAKELSLEKMTTKTEELLCKVSTPA